MDKELETLIARAREHVMTPEELEAQRISFAFGNAPEGDTNTIETVREAVTNARVSSTKS